MSDSSGIRLLDRSGVAEARRVAVQHAGRAGFDDAGRSNVAIVATELASNLLRHARDGALSITSRRSPAESSVLLVAVDKGPGMSDVEKSFSDGYSSAGSSGTGLGAVARLSTVLDVYSTPAGTVLVAELTRKTIAAAPSLRIGGFSLEKEGQEMNGDAWASRLVGSGIAVLVCDGLGHGAYASEASSAACAAFRAAEWRGPESMLVDLHAALRATRGAAAAIAFLDPVAGRVRYSGVGNISGCIVLHDRSRQMVSHNGILGHTHGRMAEFDYEFGPGSSLVMHTDGIGTRWQPADLGPIWERHPGLVAGMLYRHFARGNDDVAAVVVKP